jgi:hypothetical protein
VDGRQYVKNFTKNNVVAIAFSAFPAKIDGTNSYGGCTSWLTKLPTHA